MTKEYEYPFRITDWHGEVVADELDNVPPLLNQEEIDMLTAHLASTAITSVAVWSALRKMPDSEYGAGEIGPARPHCQKCGAQIGEDTPMETAFGYFYHGNCLRMAAEAVGSGK